MVFVSYLTLILCCLFLTVCRSISVFYLCCWFHVCNATEH